MSEENSDKPLVTIDDGNGNGEFVGLAGAGGGPGYTFSGEQTGTNQGSSEKLLESNDNFTKIVLSLNIPNDPQENTEISIVRIEKDGKNTMLSEEGKGYNRRIIKGRFSGISNAGVIANEITKIVTDATIAPLKDRENRDDGTFNMVGGKRKSTKRRKQKRRKTYRR